MVTSASGKRALMSRSISRASIGMGALLARCSHVGREPAFEARRQGLYQNRPLARNGQGIAAGPATALHHDSRLRGPGEDVGHITLPRRDDVTGLILPEPEGMGRQPGWLRLEGR